MGNYTDEELAATTLREFCGQGYEKDAKFSISTFELATTLRTKVEGVRKLFAYANSMAAIDAKIYNVENVENIGAQVVMVVTGY